jgi:hypothetical protein
MTIAHCATKPGSNLYYSENCPQNAVHEVELKESSRMLGINTGNPEADSEAGMWLMALIGTLAAAVPVAFLSPSLGKNWRWC